MRAQYAFTLESDLLRNALRGVVVRICDQLEPLEPEVLERVSAEKAKGSSRQTAPASLRSAPVTDVTVAQGVVRCEADRTNDASVLGYCELPVPDPRDLTAHKGTRVLLRIRAGDVRDPMLNLTVVAGVDDGRNVIEGPRSQLQIAVSKFHAPYVP